MLVDEEKGVFVQVPINVSDRGGKPYLELRKAFFDKENIKQIVSAAFHNEPIAVLPVFTDTFRGINSLVQKGIIYKEGDNYYFTL